MPKIRTDALQEGMVTSADVKNMDDMLLIPSGCALTQKHIRILKTWGVHDVQVEPFGDAQDGENGAAAAVNPEEWARIEQELKSKFWEFNQDEPFYVELLRLVTQRKAKRTNFHADESNN
jgi:hypothetical protein